MFFSFANAKNERIQFKITSILSDSGDDVSCSYCTVVTDTGITGCYHIHRSDGTFPHKNHTQMNNEFKLRLERQQQQNMRKQNAHMRHEKKIILNYITTCTTHYTHHVHCSTFDIQHKTYDVSSSSSSSLSDTIVIDITMPCVYSISLFFFVVVVAAAAAALLSIQM